MIEELKKIPKTILATIGTLLALTIIVTFQFSPNDSDGFTVLGGKPLPASYIQENLLGIYEFDCSPVVEVLPYDFRGAFVFDNNKNIGDGLSTIGIKIYNNFTNPKEAFEKLVYAYSSSTECAFKSISFIRSTSTPVSVFGPGPVDLNFNLKDVEVRERIMQDVEPK